MGPYNKARPRGQDDIKKCLYVFTGCGGRFFRPNPLVPLAEAVGDEGGEGFKGGFRVRAVGFDADAAAGRGGEHHQAHDRGAGDRLAFAGDGNAGIELLGKLDEFCRRPGVKAPIVDDLDFADVKARFCFG